MSILSRLNLVHFRCYQSFQIDFPEAGGVILGDNAEGKTSLLEAICVLLRLQSPRSSRQSPLVRHGESYFGLAGMYNGVRRRLLWNAKNVEYYVHHQKRADQRDYLSDSGLIVWMGNDDMELVRGRAEARRRYLDFIGLQWMPEYRQALSYYKHALRSRNVLLKKDKADTMQIQAYTYILVQQGEALVQMREQLIENLTPYIQEAHHILTKKSESLEFIYKPSTQLPLAEAYARALSRELILGQTLIGPHRDDVALLLEGKPADVYSSEGQQRTLALALKLAQHRLFMSEKSGQSPLLLIDDVFGELDISRRNALFEALPQGTQTFITTTQLHWLKDSALSLEQFTLKDHRVNKP